MNHFALALVTSLVFTGACSDEDFDPDQFVGAYRNTLTITGTGSQTLTDAVSISEGSTSDLIITSQNLGPIRATVIGDTSFSLDQQQITLTDGNGQAVSVTVQGQGTVNDGVFNSNGMLSTSGGSLSFTWAGSRL
jgi:hypothetical protein